MPMNLSNSKGSNLSLVVGHEGVIAHNVALGAYNTNKFLEFIQTKVHPHGQRLVKYNKLLKMLDTSTSIFHHIVHFSML
jgi:pyoverdine/dityrosine biosynthesis protein Dit1